MKLTTTFILATVVAGCSSSSRDRPSFDERQERIENQRNEPSARGRDRLYGPGKPAPAENDQDNDGIADQDEVAQADEAKADEAKADEAKADGAKADGTKAEPDNTALNERDRDSSSLTPLDQSNTKSDVEITQMIRKKVIGDDGLSFNAKNIKIITVSGKVTLRGPVESRAESATIERSARDVPGVKRVDNQLEVK